jgi:hypothetical protein
MSHYFLSVHEPKKAGVLLLGRQILAIPLFLVLPRWFGINGMYYVGPCADLPFALVAAGFIVKELRALSSRIAGEPRAAPVTEIAAEALSEAR